MIKILDYKEVEIKEILTRDNNNDRSVDEIVSGILEDVRTNGDTALLGYCEKFDKAKLSSLEVSQQEIDDAFSSIDPDFIKTLELARDNIEAFHTQQIRKNFVLNDKEGIVLGQKVTPIEKVGLYVPGGTASYPSSVLMNTVPAKLAGVTEIVMATPPSSDGTIAAPILAAAKVAGVTRIFKMGGAQAVAALSYGTESVPKVDKIVGPGNIFVATAKRMVYGLSLIHISE